MKNLDDIGSDLACAVSDAILDAAKITDKLKADKNSAYSERNNSVAFMAKIALIAGWKAYRALHDETDESWENDWRNILVIESPCGQLSWHFHDSEFHLISSLDLLSNYVWDGHTTEEKYKRMENYRCER